MNRMLPFRRPAPVLARGHVYPDGSAFLEVGIEGVCAEMLLSRDQVAELKEKIAAFERFVTFEDGRPVDRPRHHREAL